MIMQKVIFVSLSVMYLGLVILIRHVLLIAVSSVCINIKPLEVEVPRTIFAVGGFSTSREGRYLFSNMHIVTS
jgi:hypothetical protein